MRRGDWRKHVEARAIHWPGLFVTTSSPPPRARFWAAIPLIPLLLVAFLQRAPVVTVAPLLSQLQEVFGLNSVQASLLTGIPVLCFGLLAPLASFAVHLMGINRTMLYGLAAVVLGSLWRSDGSATGLWAGTVVMGVGMTVGNLAVPIIIGRQYRERSALLTGTCSATTNVGVTLATALTVPLAFLIGWQGAMGSWGVVIGVVSLIFWVVVYRSGMRGPRAWVLRRAGADPVVQSVRGGRAELRNQPRPMVARWPVAWLLALAFAGHTLSYYAITSWLPLALTELNHMSPASASTASAGFQVMGIAGPFVVPWLMGAAGWSVQRCAAVIGAAWAVMPAGMMLLPEGWAVWSAVGGAAQGAFFTLLFTIVVQRSRTVDESRRISSFVQMIGYSAAATGPVILGIIHSTAGNWAVAFAVVLVSVVVMTVSLLLAVRSRSHVPLRPMA